MRALVVYESMFGNTRQVAEAIGVGLAREAEVRVVPVGEIEPHRLALVDLLVVGGPTHAWGLSRPSTRENAAQQAARPERTLTLETRATGVGLREWLPTLPDGCQPEDRCAVAAFDTRVQMPSMLTGRASRKIAHLLRQHGGVLAARPESFLVTRANDLVPGELERAQAWGAELGASISRPAADAGRYDAGTRVTPNPA
jgi:hypothetical protein